MSWCQTFTGRVVYPLDIKPETICLRDIAHALALQCRFAGHCLWHFSVAQHSILVSKHLPDELAAWGLMHDAAEAYLVDLPRPVKGQMPEYRAMEDAVGASVAQRFGLEWPMPPRVKLADLEALATERRDLMAPCEQQWELDGVNPWAERLERWTWEHAESTFLAVADKLKVKERG